MPIKRMIILLKMNINRYVIMALLTFTILACKKDNAPLTKVILISNINKTEESLSLDSIVYLYNTIQDDKIYVSQSIHIGNTKQVFYYYLYNKKDFVFLGINTIGDSIIYYPYCSLTSHDTIIYDISYLDNINGFTVLVKDVNSSLKEYTGNLIFLNFMDSTTWTLNKELIIEKIRSGNLVLDKKEEEHILKYPDDYQKPINKSIEIFMPPSEKYFFKSKI